MTNNVFDPAKHKVVAVDEHGQHLHVTLGELKADMASLSSVEAVALPPPVPLSNGQTDRLAVAVALATHAILSGVQAGDLRWHGGGADFEWAGVAMDAPTLIEYAKTQL